MKAKEFLGGALMTMCALSMTLMMTACGDDDHDSSRSEDITPVAITTDYKLTVDNVAFNDFNLTVEYYDADGNRCKEVMNQPTWQKTVKSQLPANLGMRLLVVKKDGVELPDDGSRRYSWSYSYYYQVLNKSDKTLNEYGLSATPTSAPKSGKMDAWLNDAAKGIIEVRCMVDAKGQRHNLYWEE